MPVEKEGGGIMRYQYPKLVNTLRFRQVDEFTVEVTDYYEDETYLFAAPVLRLMRQLDGHTDPFSLAGELEREEIAQLMTFLRNNKLIRFGTGIRAAGGMLLMPLWKPKDSGKLKMTAKALNTALMLLWLPVFILGVILFTKNILNIGFHAYLAGYAGILVGLVLHEMGHAVAAIAYGAPVAEAGFLIAYLIFPGGYVMMDKEFVKNRLQRVQIDAAGVESNMLLAGCFLLLSVPFPALGGIFMTAALTNVVLAFFNFSAMGGFDGMNVLGELLGHTKYTKTSGEILFSKAERKKLVRRGLAGKATLASCVILQAMQLGLPILLLLSVVEVVSWIF